MYIKRHYSGLNMAEDDYVAQGIDYTPDELALFAKIAFRPYGEELNSFSEHVAMIIGDERMARARSVYQGMNSREIHYRTIDDELIPLRSFKDTHVQNRRRIPLILLALGSSNFQYDHNDDGSISIPEPYESTEGEIALIDDDSKAP